MPYIPELKKSLCDRCLRPSSSQCTGCHVAKYCSRACQAADHPRHRELCGPLYQHEQAEAGWRRWIRDNREAMNTMIRPGRAIDLTIEDGIETATDYDIGDYLDRVLSPAERSRLLRYIWAEGQRGGRPAVNIWGVSPGALDMKEYQARNVDSQLELGILAVDGAPCGEADPADAAGWQLVSCQYSHGRNWELVSRPV